jgi:MFS family permease
MTAAEATTNGVGRQGGMLDRERIIARPGFNRWLVPPAALAIHLCIGMAYGFSVFWLPLSRSLGIQKAVACPDLTLVGALFTTACDWRISDLGWMYTLFFVFLGSSAALWGGWLERVGPRKAGVVAAFCWCGGLLISAVGVCAHQFWMLWIGSGVIGGIGLGLGYISPVSTLVKWFPDRRGMATGMAIMGFGGGAMIGARLANILMNQFRTADSVGVWQTFIAIAALYFVFMLGGAFGYRLPPVDWRPEGWTPPPSSAGTMITQRHVHLRDAHKTPQFWLIWAVLMLNVSAGIGVIGMASPMLQEIFGGSLIGHPDLGFTQLNDEQRRMIATIAAGFAGLLSLFNIGGRIFWASMSDHLGRKATYYTLLKSSWWLAAFQSWKRWTNCSKRENGSALRLLDSEIRQYRQICAHGAWRNENRSPFPTIALGITHPASRYRNHRIAAVEPREIRRTRWVPGNPCSAQSADCWSAPSPVVHRAAWRC